MIIELGEEKTVITKVQETVIVSSIKLINTIDNPTNKIVIANIRIGNTSRQLILWSGDDYDTIGDWTQAQAITKILTLLS